MPTVVGQPIIKPLHRVITVISPYTGDTGGNNYARLLWKPAGTQDWLGAFPMSVNRATRQWHGAVWGNRLGPLSGNADYELKIEYTDPQGASPAWTGAVKTQADVSPLGTGPTFVIDPVNGSDAYSGSDGNPFKTLQRGVRAIVPGTTLLLREGAPYYDTIAGYFGLTCAMLQPDLTDIKGSVMGTNPGSWYGARNPITIAAYPGHKPVIDGQNAIGFGIQVGYYGRQVYDVVLRGLTVRNTLDSSTYTYSSGTVLFLTVEDCDLEEAHFGGGSRLSSNVEMRGQFLILRRCRLTDLEAPPVAGGWKTNVDGLMLYEVTTGNHSVYENYFKGYIDQNAVSRGMRDGVATGREGSPEGWGKDSENINNTYEGMGDDPWQADGGDERVVHGFNKVKDPQTSMISLSPVKSGPCYVVRNLGYCTWEHRWIPTGQKGNGPVAFKCGSGSSAQVLIIHNTLLNCASGVGINAGGGTPAINQEYYNNILHTWDKGPLAYMNGLNKFDYNLYWNTRADLYLVDCISTYLGGQKFYGAAGFAQYQQLSGQDLHSVVGEPKLGPDYVPLEGSPAVDRGVLFLSAPPNDLYNGNAPDIGALESGSTAQTFNLTVTVRGNGTTQPAGTVPFLQGSATSIQPLAAQGWKFDHWEGDASGSQNPLPVTMDRPKSIVAVFVELPATIAFAVDGAGAIRLNGATAPATIQVPKGTSMSLAASADAGWRFVSWVGSLVSTNPDETVVATADMSITAVFVRITFNITILQGANGNTIPPSGLYPTNEGEGFDIQAIGNGGYQFREWRENGVAFSTTNPLPVVATRAMAIEPVFELIPVLPGQFAVTITVVGKGMTYPDAPRSYTIEEGTVLQEQAVPDDGNRFLRWEYGGLTSKNPNLVVQVVTDLSIVAYFEPAPAAPKSIPVLAIAGGFAGLALLAAVMRKP